MNTRVIGIDLAVSAKHKAMIFDPACNEFVGKQIVFRPRPQEMDRLLNRARQGAPADVQLIAVLEATGMAWYPVSVYLERQGVTVYRINGQKTKDFRQAFWKHTSSDQIDCRILARLYYIAPDRLHRCPLPDGQLLDLQRACRAYARWREQDTAMQNRMQAVDQWAWGGLRKLVPAAAQPWMREQWYNPWHVLAAGKDRLAAAWETFPAAEKTGTAWIDRWLLRAQEMTLLYGSQQMVGYDALQADMRQYLRLRQLYAQEQDRLTQEKILPLYQQLFPDCPLTSIWGIGSQSAATYRAFIHDINRFPTTACFRRWCGITPRSHQSGEAEAKGLPLSKAGPNLIKATLFLNAEVARQWDVQIAYIYHQQMVQYGKHHLKAVCACASHLANRIYAVLKEQRPYQLRDLRGRPISPEESRRLCLQYAVPEEIRRRNNKRFRRNKREQAIEKRTQKRQQRG